MVSLFFFISGCKESNDLVPAVPEGRLLNYEGCKDIQHGTAGELSLQKVQECIEYEYDGVESLTINHTNATFNCCPGEIVADFEFNGNVITIVERETNPICYCLCYFDVDYHFTNIAFGAYTLRIVCADGKTREYDIVLIAAQSGKKCWETGY